MLALEQWPEQGVPDKPGAWLTATAKHKAIDRIRRDGRGSRSTRRSPPIRPRNRRPRPAPDAVDGVER